MGFNARLEAIQAAILGAKLPYLDQWNEMRRQNAKRYDTLLGGLDLKLPYEAPYAKSVFHLYVIRAPKRDSLNACLNEQGIGSLIHYPKPNHLLDCCKQFGYKQGSLPVTEKIAKDVLSLPLYPELTEEQIQTIAEAIKSFQASQTPSKRSPVARLRK